MLIGTDDAKMDAIGGVWGRNGRVAGVRAARACGDACVSEAESLSRINEISDSNTGRRGAVEDSSSC